MRAVNGRRGFEDVGELGRQTGVTSFFLGAGEFVAGFEITELIFEQDHLGAEEKIFVGIVGGVVGDGVIPGALFGGGERRFGGRRDLQRGLGGFRAAADRRSAALLTGLLVKRVMQIKPEAAVQFEDRERAVEGIGLRAGRKRMGTEKCSG